MIISVLNHSNGKISDEELHRVIRAINRQITEDFTPYWGESAMLRLEGHSTADPNAANPVNLRGEAILYVWDKSDLPDALGYHQRNHEGVPYGFVFLDVAERAGENWTVTMSHEALELIADPEVNLLVMGPHPKEPEQTVFHWYEMCDAVQGETYQIDGVEVSNFVLPLYFTGAPLDESLGGRRDFLSRSYHGQTLRSFGVNPGGYLGFYNPETGLHDNFAAPNDHAARRALEARQTVSERRGNRYARNHREARPRSHARLSTKELEASVLQRLKVLLAK